MFGWSTGRSVGAGTPSRACCGGACKGTRDGGMCSRSGQGGKSSCCLLFTLCSSTVKASSLTSHPAPPSDSFLKTPLPGIVQSCLRLFSNGALPFFVPAFNIYVKVSLKKSIGMPFKAFIKTCYLDQNMSSHSFWARVSINYLIDSV